MNEKELLPDALKQHNNDSEHGNPTSLIVNTDKSTDPYGNTYPDGGIKAWSVVFGCFCAFFSALSTMNSLGSYQAYLSTHALRNHTPGEIGWLFGSYAFFSFFLGIQIGPLFDAYGPRPLIFVGSGCLLAMYLILGICKIYWHFFLVLSVLGGLSTCLLFIPAIATVQHWFYAHRGFATGIAVSGGSVGGIALPVILEHLLPTLGFAWTTRILALVNLPFVAAACLLIRGRVVNTLVSTEGAVRKMAIFPDLTSLMQPRMAVMTAGIYFMEWGLFIPLSYITSGALYHGVPFATSYQLLTFLNVGSLIGRWGAGWMGDKIGKFNTTILALLLCLVAILGMWMPAAGNVGVLIAFALIFGLGSGSNISMTPVCLAQLCKTDEFGRVYSAVYTISSFGVCSLNLYEQISFSVFYWSPEASFASYI